MTGECKNRAVIASTNSFYTVEDLNNPDGEIKKKLDSIRHIRDKL